MNSIEIVIIVSIMVIIIWLMKIHILRERQYCSVSNTITFTLLARHDATVWIIICVLEIFYMPLKIRLWRPHTFRVVCEARICRLGISHWKCFLFYKLGSQEQFNKRVFLNGICRFRCYSIILWGPLRICDILLNLNRAVGALLWEILLLLIWKRFSKCLFLGLWK